MAGHPAARGGLEEVVAGSTAISEVDGERGGLAYRGFTIADIVAHLGYEGTVDLLWSGQLPGTDPPHPLTAELAGQRTLPPSAEAILDALPPRTDPMDALRMGLSALGSYPYPPTREQGIALVAAAPTVLARFHRRRSGLEPIAPDPGLGHIANFLYMLEGRPATRRRVYALESYCSIVADHGMNASTFALRVVLSTQSDLLSAAAAAIGALKGPLHGGAPSKAVEMLDAVGSPDNAEAWVRAALARKERLMGFGHRAYKVEDPRAVLLRKIAERVAAPERFALAARVEEVALAELRRAKPQERLFTNVEFYAGVVLEASALPRDLYPALFGMARTAGWAAHAIEQAAHNRLIRPGVEYTGARGLAFPASAPLRPLP
ncbi:MAG TPA: citrate synthase [Thermoplasmata archaeon]|nr:citrate synthase [Thermoplasmata archaeon]